MKIIVGLGNPGFSYKGTRHNIGFSILELLAASLKIVLKRDNSVFSSVGKSQSDKLDLILAKPSTFMNLSGTAVKALLKKFKAKTEDLLVICDDMDLELGRMKIRPSGSSGGHRGLISIIECLNSQDFCRLRVGIGRPDAKTDPAEYVLSGFSSKEKIILGEAKEKALDCCFTWIKEGTAKTMSMFNTSSPMASRTAGRQSGRKNNEQV